MNRKQFLKTTLVGVSTGMILPQISWTQNPQNSKGPAVDKELVKQFVTEAHRDDAKVKSMLEETPDLLNVVHNWGGWDWEDAVGAAAHMGNPDLTNFLLSKGARMTICVAAMLGHLNIVKAMIEAFPYMKEAKGPHNISLLRHAQKGGDKSEVVVEYLNSIGVKE